MTGKVLENNNAAGILILIFPLALGIVILYKAWPFLLLILALGILWKIWESYQWHRWAEKVNPYFNQLIRENQGCLTPVDLSLKANLTGGAAKRFLERKAEEYGAQRKVFPDKGTVYYFLTASSLGSILDQSEPFLEGEEEEETASLSPASSSDETTTEDTSKTQFALLLQKAAEAEANAPPPPEVEAETEPEPEAETPSDVSQESTTPETPEIPEEKNTGGRMELIQADLAKRLDLNSSTLSRKKSDDDFALWSQSKDPDGLAWEYLAKKGVFVSKNA